MRKTIEALREDASKLAVIPGCKRVIGYGSYFKVPGEFDEGHSDYDLCVEVDGDVLAAVPLLRELENAGMRIGRGPGSNHVWVLNEDSLRPSRINGQMHQHSEAIIRDGVVLWSRK